MFFFLLSFSLANSDQSQISTNPSGEYVHYQSFSRPGWEKNYFTSTLPQYTGAWKLENSNFPPYEPMLYTQTPIARYSLSTTFDSPLNLHDQPLIIQYEVHLQESLTCGSATIKLYGKDFNPDFVSPTTPFLIQFGPDRCGSTNKVIFNFCHKDSKTGRIQEHRLINCPEMKNDQYSHLYTLIIRPDNTFSILIDSLSVKEGSLLNGFQPEVNPAEKINDPTDKKPSDWVENEMMPDPTARKPDDWDETEPEFIPNPAKLNPPKGWLVDEPVQIPNPKISKPDNWDDEFFGPWSAPLIDNPACENARGCGKYYPPAIRNPKYKGKWKAPEIKNPLYKGKWAPRQIPNPDFYSEDHVHNFETILGIGFEFKSVSKGIGIDNVLVATTESVVQNWTRQFYFPKKRLQNIEAQKLEPRAGAPEFPRPSIPSASESKVNSHQNGKKQLQQQINPVINGAIAQVNHICEVILVIVSNFYDENTILAVVIITAFTSLPFILFIANCLFPPIPNKPNDDHHPKTTPNHNKKNISRIIYVYDDGQVEVKIPSVIGKNKGE